MASNTPKENRTNEIAADQKLIDGLPKHAATLPSFLIAYEAVQPAKATWQATIQQARSEIAATKSVVSAVKQAILTAFAGQVDTLADFGLTPRKVRVLSPQQKVAAAAKSKATRAARHTTGSVQKQAVKGDVTGVVVTPVTSAPGTVVSPPGGPASPTPAGSTTTSGGAVQAPAHST